MSFVRGHNKFCLSLDNSSNNVSSNTTHLNRWSEVVPPKSALTFAALWDPQEGMVTFSGAALLETDGPLDTSPHPSVFLDDDDDNLAQFISVDREVTATNDNTATLATFQDAFKAFLHRTPWSSREHLQTTTTKLGSWSGRATPRGYGIHTCASSTLDGMDIYSHDVQFKQRISLQEPSVDLLDIESSFRTPSAFGKLRLRSDLMLDAYHTEPENVSTVAGNRPCLKSRFSSSTASTSNYIDVAPSSLQTTRVCEASAVVAPKLSKDPAGSWSFLPRRRRLLRKRRSPLGGNVNIAATSSNSLPDTPRKASTPASPSSLSPTTACSSSSPSTTLSPATTLKKERRRRLRRIGSASNPMTPMPTLMPTSTSSATATSPVAPSNSQTPRIKLFRLALLLSRWRTPPPISRRSRCCRSVNSDSDSEGWVCVDITPVIRQRYVANLDEDDEYMDVE